MNLLNCPRAHSSGQVELQKQVLPEETELELSVNIATKYKQQQTSSINQIPPFKFCHAVHDVKQGPALPLHAGDANIAETLWSQILQACNADYGNNFAIQYSKQLADGYNTLQRIYRPQEISNCAGRGQRLCGVRRHTSSGFRVSRSFLSRECPH